MALASAPTTPDRGTQHLQLRRAFTAPTKTTRQSPLTHEAEAQGAETLFAHNAVKIVSFSTASNPGRRFSASHLGPTEGNEEPTGTLPWASLTERTIAAGPLSVYRVLGSVAFLRSGATLHPILAKSQCWCVDGVSKFVLRIRAYSYYRIELPSSSDEEMHQVENFKLVLDKVLQYEKTPCPFKRGFSVELPEAPETPVKRVPWTPKRKVEPEPASPSPALEHVAAGNKNARRSFTATTEAEDASIETNLEHSPPTKVADYPPERSNCSSRTSTAEDVKDETTVSSTATRRALFEQNQQGVDPTRPPERPTGLMVARNVTAPPQLSLWAKHSHQHQEPVSPAETPIPGDVSSSFSSSVDSFCSFHSVVSPSSPSPRTEESVPSELSIPRIRGHEPHHSEVTMTPKPRDSWDLRETSPETPINHPHPSTLLDDATSMNDIYLDSPTVAPPGLRVRHHLKKRREQSPLPPSANLYVPYSPKGSMSGNHLTTAILQRTCSFLLGPPVHLVALMLRIATRITHGVLQGSTCGVGERGEKIPCAWDFSSDASEGSEDDWNEDDYGASLCKTVSGNMVKPQTVGGSWEID